MKLQNLTVIFIIIILPIILIMSLYINTGLKTIKYQTLYDDGLLTATHDAIYAFEINTNNDEYSANPEVKRDILKASVKMFETSLCNTCNISTYHTSEIEEYIPAIVFGLYDGFYMYAPSYSPSTGKYEHSLKNYVYYSENLDDEGTTIRYSLDNYVVVSGDFGEGYETREGFLIDPSETNSEGTEYKGITIGKETIDGKENSNAINYYKDAYEFTTWFNQNLGDKVKDKNRRKYLLIGSNNDPESYDSKFSIHKREIIKSKIESVLNSSITSYSKRLDGYNYKMPKFSADDWQKIYNNISVISFFQGKDIGFTKYNGYCVLNSTNSNEYVNPDLVYFVDEDNYYHDIRCTEYEGDSLTGYKIGSFQKRRVEQIDETTGETKTDANGSTLYEYVYKRKELACYNCINSSLETSSSVYDYVRGDDSATEIKKSYFTALARERYDQHFLKVEEEQLEVDSDEEDASDETSELATLFEEFLGERTKDEVIQLANKIILNNNNSSNIVSFANYSGDSAYYSTTTNASTILEYVEALDDNYIYTIEQYVYESSEDMQYNMKVYISSKKEK